MMLNHWMNTMRRFQERKVDKQFLIWAAVLGISLMSFYVHTLQQAVDRGEAHASVMQPADAATAFS